MYTCQDSWSPGQEFDLGHPNMENQLQRSVVLISSTLWQSKPNITSLLTKSLP